MNTNSNLSVVDRVVDRNGLHIRRISPKDHTPEICMAAVKQNGYAIQWVKEQTPDLLVAAVRQNKRSIDAIEYRG